MAESSLSEKLAAFRLFEGVSEGELESLASVFHARTFQQNEILTEFDRLDHNVFFIISGKATVTVPHVNKQRHEFVCDLRDGDTVGEFLLARTARRTASCTAFTKVETLYTNGEELSRLLQQNTALGMKVFLNLSRILCDRLLDNNHLVRRVLGGG
jgi:CRP-like cAMP-binding protein